jgi:hypothetical protein
MDNCNQTQCHTTQLPDSNEEKTLRSLLAGRWRKIIIPLNRVFVAQAHNVAFAVT